MNSLGQPLNITNMALVVAHEREEPMLSDELGNEVIIFIVGAEQAQFTIHKDLLLKVAPIFEEHLNGGLNVTERVILADELPAMFRLFVTYAYSKHLPIVTSNMPALQQMSRLRDLCQLFVFAEKFYMPHVLTNQILDSIQNGFLLTGELPNIGLIRGVYKHSQEGSKLRQFIAHCVVYGVRSDDSHYYDNLGFLQENGELLTDFVTAVKLLDGDNKDPRVRDCGGEEGCTECADGKVPAHRGYWPCAFHIHDMVRQSPDGSAPTVTASDIVLDTGCYLWHQ